MQQQQLESNAKGVQQLERMQQQLELNLEREAAFRKKGWTVSQNLVANIEDAGSSAEAAEIDRFISRSSRLMFGDSPARGSDSAEVFNESVRELDPAGASDSSSDSEWEWHALV